METNKERFEADYLIETPVSPERAAAAMAGEQSSGTFVSVPGDTPELQERSAARVEHLEAFGIYEGRFSDGALLAIDQAKSVVFKETWLDDVFNLDAIKKSVQDICAD